MNQSFYERIGESVYQGDPAQRTADLRGAEAGLRQKYAFFATRYGGMDTRFQLDGKWLDTPAGIAHYLEHKMFDTKEGNALQELAKKWCRAKRLHLQCHDRLLFRLHRAF